MTDAAEMRAILVTTKHRGVFAGLVPHDQDIAAPTMAHIHKGAAGSDGSVVVTLNITGNDGDECSALQRDLAKAIVAAPGDYYVNVHNAEFPKGAIRGQLAVAAP